MSKSQPAQAGDGEGFLSAAVKARIKRWAVAILVPAVLILVVFLLMWNVFFHYVPPGKMLVITAKNGTPLDKDRVLARAGEQGIQEEVLGEGWHFVTPVIYTAELKDNIAVPAGQVGIVTNLGGKPLKEGHALVDSPDQKGIRRQVLTPGSYRINPYGYRVDLVEATTITPGHVGLQRRRLGDPSKNPPFAGPGEQGVLRDVLQPGLYFINTQEYEVKECEVGIYQTSYHYDPDKSKSTGISFSDRDSFPITMDCTVEWEILPENVPDLATSYLPQKEGKIKDEKGIMIKEIEKNVINQQARKMSQNRGLNYGAKDFLEGATREKFQADFEKGLKQVCKEQKVIVHSAYIRNIIIPDQYLKLKRDRQLNLETQITNEIKQELAKSDAEVERERSMIAQKVAVVEAETKRLVAGIEQDIENVKTRTEAKLTELKAQYNADIAKEDANRTLAKGEAETSVTKMKETAKSSIYKLKLDVFQNDGNAYLRYSLAEQLNPQLRLRLFHAGPGTFWTNMDNKNLNFLLNPAGADVKREDAKPPMKDKKD